LTDLYAAAIELFLATTAGAVGVHRRASLSFRLASSAVAQWTVRRSTSQIPFKNPSADAGGVAINPTTHFI
jgi:hypothetical protein